MDRRAQALVAAGLLCGSVNVGAAVNGWTAIGPEGGLVNRIVYSATPNTVFAIAAGGFYRSQDGGVTWTLIKADFSSSPSDLAIDPSDSSRVYVTATEYPSLYASTDGGATMAAVATLPTAVTTANKMAVSHDGATVCLADGMQFFCSADRGQSWQERTPVSTYTAGVVWRLVVDPTDANTFYAAARISATNDGILCTHDGGVTWQRLISLSATTSGLLDLAINPVNPLQLWAGRVDGAWVSKDRGVSWSSSTSTFASAVALDPSNPSVVYLGGGYGQILRTSDAGAHWTDVSGDIGAGQVAAIAVNPAQSAQLLVGGYGGLAGSATSGIAWSMQQAGINSTQVAGFSADTAADRIYIEVPSSGIYYAANGAAATAPVNNAGLAQLQGAAYGALDISSMLAQPGRLSVSLPPGLALSGDGGNTWSLASITPTGSQQVFTMASSAGTPPTTLAASSSALYRSTDGGSLWTPVTNGIPASSVVGRLLSAPSDPTVAYGFLYSPPVSGNTGSTLLGTYRSADAGVSWAAANATPTAGPTTLLAVDPTAANVLYGSTASALLKSTDGGATWNALNWDYSASAGTAVALAVDPLHPNVLYASSVARIARSVDGGASWQTLRAATTWPDWGSSSLLADPKRPENILVGTSGSGVQQLTVAPDLALTTMAPTAPAPVGVATAYTFTVSNLGPFDATGVRVTMQVPSTAQSVYATSAGATCTTAASTVTCVYSVLRTGASNPLILTALAPAAGTFQVTGSVAGDQPDSNSGNNTVTSAAAVAMVADLGVTATGSATANVGDPVNYTLTVANAGPDAAASTTLTYQLPAGLRPSSATSTGATCAIGNSSLITCNLGTMAVAAQVAINVDATAAAAGTQTATATASSSASDPVSANNSASTSTTVSAAADLSVTATGSATASVGDLVNYTLSVSNAGPDSAASTTVSYQLPAGLTPASATSTGATCTIGNSSLITCNIGTMAVAAQVAINIGATAAAAGTQSAIATVSSSTLDPVSANNSASTSTTVSAAPAGHGGGAWSAWELAALTLVWFAHLRRRVAHPGGPRVTV